MAKYIILKGEEFEALKERVSTRLGQTERATMLGTLSAVEDLGVEGFVLRPQDIFGAAALWAYAHLLQTAVELGMMRAEAFTEEEIERLDRSSAQIAALAEEWQLRGENRKIPD